MAEPGVFNPYLKWLAIPLEEQPPHHYRLLGISVFEDDPEVVEAAVEQRSGFLRKHQTGPHGAEAGKLLNEVATARLCLLNPRKKAAYDAQLQAQSGGVLVSSDSSTAPLSARLRSLPPTWIAAGVLVVVGLGAVVWLSSRSAPGPRPAGTVVAATEHSDSGQKSPRRKPSKKSKSTAKQDGINADDPNSEMGTDQPATSQELALNEKPNRSRTKSESRGDTFRTPEGALILEEEMPAKSDSAKKAVEKPAAPPSDPTTGEEPEKTSTDTPPSTTDKPAEEISDPKLRAAVPLLERASDTANEKLFKTLRAKLAECKSPPKRQKPLTPALQAELEKLLAACDRKEFPPIRVQGTVSWNGHDYVYVNADFTWNTAREICQAMGGHLVTLTSGPEASYVESTFLRPNDKPAWIGGSDAAEEGKWVWVTGEPWQFWARINDDFGAAHAITWWRDLGFHDWLGDKRQAYVCEWDSNASPDLIALGSDTRIFQAMLEAHHQARLNRLAHREKLFKAVHAAAERLGKTGGSDQVRALYEKFGFEAPPPQRFRHKKSEYFLFREAKTWHEAEAHCERLGGHLVILDDTGEPDVVFAEALKNSISIWLGCSDERLEGQWRWLNNTPLKLKLITDNLGGDQHVGWAQVKNNKITLFDMNAGVRSAYICEWEME
ncbi:MAG: hypothetical protein JWN70_9 [Planctomycetaceae bacterium]|nr:hypothetical protein [Planctomycetaceae bacterium]